MFYLEDFIAYILQFRICVLFLKIYAALFSFKAITEYSDFTYVGHNKCVLQINDIKGNFPCFRYPKSINLNFHGWNPLFREDEYYIYVIGLPESLSEGSHISIENKVNKEKRIFTHKDGFIDWKTFFEVFEEHTFHDDLD